MGWEPTPNAKLQERQSKLHAGLDERRVVGRCPAGCLNALLATSTLSVHSNCGCCSFQAAATTTTTTTIANTTAATTTPPAPAAVPLFLFPPLLPLRLRLQLLLLLLLLQLLRLLRLLLLLLLLLLLRLLTLLQLRCPLPHYEYHCCYDYYYYSSSCCCCYSCCYCYCYYPGDKTDNVYGGSDHLCRGSPDWFSLLTSFVRDSGTTGLMAM